MRPTPNRRVPARLLRISFLALLGAPLAAQCATAWEAGAPPPGFVSTVSSATLWDPDGPGPQGVSIAALSGTGPSTHVALRDLATGAEASLVTPPLLNFPGIESQLLAMPGGDLLLIGFNINPTPPVQRWTGTGWAALGSGLTGVPRHAAVTANGELFVSGTNLTIQGSAAGTLVRWDGTQWSPIMNAPLVQALPTTLAAASNGDLLVGGNFTAIGGVPANRIARWNGAWSALGAGLPTAPGAILELNNGDLLADGQRWNGASWSTLGTPPQGVLTLAELPNGELVAGGAFTTPANNVARWDGAVWSGLATGFDNPVRNLLVLPGGELAAFGSFYRAGELVVGFGATWNGASWRPFGDGLSAGVEALLAAADDEVIASGAFATAGGQLVRNIARSDGATWQPLGSGLGGRALALARAANGDVIAGGAFATAGGAPANNVARWDGVSWSALGNGADGPVKALAVLPNGDIVAGGTFATAGGQPARGIARWDGAAWSALGGGVDGSVFALVAVGNDVFVGGEFGTAGGVPVSNVARWDGNSWSALGGGADQPVDCLALSGNGDVLAGGPFAVVGGVAARGVARWHGTGWAATAAPLTGFPRAIVEHPNGDLFVGGAFSPNGIRRWDGSSWSIVSTTERETGAIVLVGDALVEGGELVSALDRLPAIGRIVSSCPAAIESLSTPCVGPAGPLALASATLPWLGATLAAEATGFASGALGAALLGFGPANTPLSALHPSGLPGCALGSSADLITLVLPTGGTGSYALAVPNASHLVGIALFEQFLQLEIAGSTAASLSSSNVLRATIGVF